MNRVTETAHDTLAQLPNRQVFFSALGHRLGEASAEARMLGLLVCRLRNLREVNAELGYEGGDELLAGLAARIGRCLRPVDSLARVGSAEFALILPRLVGAGQVALAANKIVQACRAPIACAGGTVRPRVIVGGALYPDHGSSCESLLRSAELAAAAASESGEAYELYSPQGSVDSLPMLALEGELEAAIETGELELHYQPKLDLGSGRLAGVESLARWTSASLGPVRPDVFVAIAERSGLILPLTMLTLNIALRQCRELAPARGAALPVAVNLSPAVLNNREVGALVARAMRIWDAEPETLTLEVTESAMMADPAASLETLKALRALGVRISIDDFGTGYSSLAYLKTLPVGELKIDKSFVQNMAGDAEDASIVRAVVDLAHNFGLAVVAEGVEDNFTLERLAGLGCEYAQGFHIAKPMPAEALERWMRSTGARP